MNVTNSRSAIFLDEMGVGVQWQLRQRPAAPDAGEVLAEAPALSTTPVSAPAPAPAPAPPPAPVHATAPAPVAPPIPSHVAADSTTPQAEAASRSDADLNVDADADVDVDADTDTAWFDDVPAPAPAAPISDAEIASLDWPSLRRAISQCTRCTLCESRRHPLAGRGSPSARTIALVAAPSLQDEQERQVVAGDAGQLLANMLKAIDLDVEADVYVTPLVKCRPANEQGLDRAPTGEELLVCRPYLERELALTGATLALTFGQHAARGLMLGAAARGAVLSYGAAGLPVVATYHPQDLLQRRADKARAWADLCLARSVRD